MNIEKKQLLISLKGFAMGMADIVPGVSGGTVALITGVYNELIKTISSFNKEAIKLLLKFQIKDFLKHMNGPFIIPLFIGIILAILTMSRLMHFLMSEYAVYTWSLFFGLIIASIFFVARLIPNLKSPSNIVTMIAGGGIGYAVVSLIPVHTPDTPLMFFLSGAIAICAMILPGISGSFILLILGKYLTVTSALKNPFADGNLLMIAIFCIGCFIGLVSFSKFLNYVLDKFYGKTMSLLTGFMIGSLKKIWPWREVLEEKIIRGKTHVLRDQLILPAEANIELFLAVACMFIGAILILTLERAGNKN